MSNNPYVRSNYERIKDDNYQTIDERCIKALIYKYPITTISPIIDVCAPNGSSIVDSLLKQGFKSFGVSDAFMDGIEADWIITNPPYKRNMVDKIIERQIRRIEQKEVFSLAVLLRTSFDHAITRQHLFNNRYYAGQFKLLFRPYWSEERKASPIHNYVWHIWSYFTNPTQRPYVIYLYPPKSE